MANNGDDISHILSLIIYALVYSEYVLDSRLCESILSSYNTSRSFRCNTYLLADSKRKMRYLNGLIPMSQKATVSVYIYLDRFQIVSG